MYESMYIHIPILDRTWRPGSYIIASEYPQQAWFHLPRFTRFMAVIMAEEIQNAITEQRYPWMPLTIPYMKYKERKELSLNIWEATGLLKSSIRNFRMGRSWLVGIDPNLFYPDTDVRVIDVARWMEYGTEKMPARPLFRPVTEYLRKSIRRYWNLFMLEAGGALY